VALALLFVLPGTACATFPGGNGKIAFTDFNRPELTGAGVFVTNADGTDQTLLTAGTDLPGRRTDSGSPSREPAATATPTSS
jgi:hypothetical protein